MSLPGDIYAVSPVFYSISSGLESDGDSVRLRLRTRGTRRGKSKAGDGDQTQAGTVSRRFRFCAAEPDKNKNRQTGKTVCIPHTHVSTMEKRRIQGADISEQLLRNSRSGCCHFWSLSVMQLLFANVFGLCRLSFFAVIVQLVQPVWLNFTCTSPVVRDRIGEFSHDTTLRVCVYLSKLLTAVRNNDVQRCANTRAKSRHFYIVNFYYSSLYKSQWLYIIILSHNGVLVTRSISGKVGLC